MEFLDFGTNAVTPTSSDLSHGPKRLKKNWESSSSSSWSPLYGGGAHLDQEAIQYIHKFYCKDCRMEAERAKAAAAAGDNSKETDSAEQEPNSPQYSLEEMSLQQSMDKNKESLKRKLLMRRSVIELVDQGIYPPLKTPPAFAEQRKHLERAKTGDLLKHKIQHRPDRQLLVQQHILEDTKIDPSLHERQRKLKRARIADDLNDKLSHRPGPLELIQGNILQTDNENLKFAIKDGSIPFNKTFDEDSESSFVFDEESTNSESIASPRGDDSGMSDIGSPPVMPSVTDIPNTFQFKQRPTVPRSICTTGTDISSVVSKLSPITTQSFSITASTQLNSQGLSSVSSSSGFSKSGSSNNSSSKNRQKKQKPKTQPKSKVIKFHEYKGPPNVVKTQTSLLQNCNSETPYHIMLQQQQLFLQWQLEFQSKNLSMPVLLPAQKIGEPQAQTSQCTLQPQSAAGSQIVMTSPVTTSPVTVTTPSGIQGQPPVASQIHTVVPQTVIQGQQSNATVQPTSTIIQAHSQLQAQPPVQLQSVVQTQTSVQKKTLVQSSSSPLSSTHTPPQQSSRPSLQNTKLTNSQTVQKPLTNLEEMKVADLKAELKKRNLTVSGSKPQLIERLKPYMDIVISPGTQASNINSSVQAVSKLPVHAVVNVKSLPMSTSSEVTMNSQSSPPTSPPHFDKITNPLSPEVMDIAPPTSVLTAQMKSSLNSSQTSIPMAVDNSRPPSVNPDVAMDVDSGVDFSSSIGSFKSVSSPPATTTVTFVASPQANQPIQIIHSPVNVVPVSPSSQVTHEDLLQQQRLKIAELQKQLEESQKRLKMQQMQHQHLQEQQQQLNHLKQQTQLLHQPTSPPQLQQLVQQPNSPPQLQQQQQPTQLLQQPNSPPQLQPQTQLIQTPNSPQQAPNTITIAVSNDGKISPVPHTVHPGSSTKIVKIAAPQTISVVQNSAAGLPVSVQGIAMSAFPNVIMSNSNDKTNNANLNDILKTQTLHQSLNIVKPNTSVINTSPVTFQQPLAVSSAAKTITLSPVNGVKQTNKTISLPSSPVEAKNLVIRTSSSPFFIPMKEPPKYDEAMKNRVNQSQTLVISEAGNSSSNGKTNPAAKSQTMDDVLEILIRNGELPPSAAQEPPPTPNSVSKTSSTQTSTITSKASKPVATSLMSINSTQFQIPAFSVANNPSSVSTTVVSSSAATMSTCDVTALLAGSPGFTSDNIKRECTTPPPLIPTDSNLSGDPVNTDLLDIHEMWNPDLTSMDWTDDPTFSLDLTDTANMQTDQDMKPYSSRDLLDIPSSSADQSNKNGPHGSEPDLAALGLNDPENSNSMQMDVSDWLDVIMPSTGLTPLTANAPVAFPSDPILTPKTHQEVLDLFSFEEADFSTPTDLHTGINWEKLTESSS